MNVRSNPMLKYASALDVEPEPEFAPAVAVGGMIVTAVPNEEKSAS